MFRDIESAYNDAVALGDQRLVEMYARVWLWLIQTAKEDRQAMAPEHRRPPARAETHRSMTATTKAKPQRSPSSVLDHLKDTLGVREKRPVSLAHVKFLERPEAPEQPGHATVLPGSWPWLL
jgi:hypothetical protein